MLVVLGDLDLALPLAEVIDADLCLGTDRGLAYRLPQTIRAAKSLSRWRTIVLTVGVKEVLDRDSSAPADVLAYSEIFGSGPPEGPFRIYERSSFSCLLEEIAILLAEPNPRPYVMVVPVVHKSPGPMSVTPCLNRLMASWCKSEDFSFLPEGIFNRSGGVGLYDDPVSGRTSALWTEIVGEVICHRLDRMGA